MNISFFEEKPTLDELDFKIPLLHNLAKIKVEEMTNIIFYGQPGSGKTTKIYAFLASLFDKRVYDLNKVLFEEDRKSMIYYASIYHIEINPSNISSNEKIFFQSFLKSYVQTKNIGLNIPKIIYIKNATLLSKQSQLFLRRVIEKNYMTAKFIFEISNLSLFAEPLISRCLLIKVVMPKIEDIRNCIYEYSNKNGVIIDEKTVKYIVHESNKISHTIHLKKIFGFLRYYLLTKKDFVFLYYNTFFDIFNYIKNKKISFVIIQKIKEMIHELYIHLVPMEELIFFIFYKLMDEYSNNNKFIDKLLEITIKTEINIKKGNKDSIHTEFYIISIIELLNSS
jgi:DNA polymerase III delta prime subunit